MQEWADWWRNKHVTGCPWSSSPPHMMQLDASAVQSQNHMYSGWSDHAAPRCRNSTPSPQITPNPQRLTRLLSFYVFLTFLLIGLPNFTLLISMTLTCCLWTETCVKGLLHRVPLSWSGKNPVQRTFRGSLPPAPSDQQGHTQGRPCSMAHLTCQLSCQWSRTGLPCWLRW